jgi:hemolysin activation/secretion protein
VAVKPPALQEGVYVDRLNITGNTRFSQAELAAVVQKAIAPDPENLSATGDPTVINRRLSPAELVKASEAITKLYTERGYINSGAYVPAEVLEGAKPEIRVVEGSLESIKVQVQPPGFLWFARPLSPNYVEKRIARAVQAPLQIDQLVDVVKLLEQDPLIESISTELSPGATTGRSVLNVKVRQANPLKLILGIDNARNPTVGQLRQFVTLTHANLLGLGDRLLFGFNRSEGSRGLDLSYAIPINARNGTVSFSYSSNRGEVIEEPFRELDIKGRSQNYEIAIRQPIKQTSTEVIALSLRGIHYRNEGVFLESFNGGVPLPLPARGSDPDGKTRITALRFGQEWLKRGDRDVISLQSEFSIGINALNATQLAIPPDGRFFMWQGRGFWVHSFAPDTLLAVKAQLQLANRPLVPVEQISFGGIDTVRGYRTSTLLTDNGMFASAEMYLPVLRIPKWRSVVQVVPFFDIGRGWNRGDEQPNPSLLMSTGLGLQWKIGDNFRARLDWGIPLINSRTENGQSLRESLFFSIIFSP